MGFETFPKNGVKGSRHVFSGEQGDGLTTRDNHMKRDYMKSGGRMEFAGKAQNSEKFKTGKEAPGNTSRREYPKSSHKGKAFGTVKSQGS